jgi:hypothetical protein
MAKALINSVLVIGSAVALCAATATQAAGTGWFGGLGTARPSVDFESKNVSGSVSDTYVSRKLSTSYRLSRAWGLEMGADLGVQGGSEAMVFQNETALPSFRTKAWELSGTGTWSIGPKFGVVGKLGAYRGELSITPNQTDLPDGKTRATFGVGVKYDVSRNFRLQGGWDRYRLGPAATADGIERVDLLSIGLKYKF